MYDYIEQILGEVDSKVKSGLYVTPAASHLFIVSENGIKLNRKE